jgi:RNA polymerase sigma factor (sigma-70 family)
MKATALTEAEQNRLIIENTRLVAHIAADYRGQGVPFSDVLAQGMLGLVQAARNFEPIGKFSAFAADWIRGAMKRLVSGQDAVDPQDGTSEEDEDRVHEWQAWGIVPYETWSSLPLMRDGLPATPEKLLELYEEIAEKKDAIEAAFLSLDPRERKMVIAHYLREPRRGLQQIARDHKVSYWTAVHTIYRAVEKMRDVVKRIEENKSGVGRTGRPPDAARQGPSSRYNGRVSTANAGGPQLQIG